MAADGGIFVGKGTVELRLLPRLANRHGLIAGATGTGKTVTLQVLAEGFSRIGVPVFMADVKGDLAGIARPGEPKPKLDERAAQLGIRLERRGFPVVFWDLDGSQGHPVRATISDLGPLLLARLMGLNEIQTGVLNLAFKLADDEGLLLLDLKDLRAMLVFVAENARALTLRYGSVSSASVGAIQRALLALETQGAERFFGEPMLDIADLLQVDAAGAGIVSILAADRLMQQPKLYGTFLLWLLSELFEALPEVGDPEKPRLVFFFDEAHLLFDDAPDALVDKVEQVVRLIRSKGVGVYFVTQNPLDIPERVLAQLGNRVQHALRAFSPRDQRAVRAAAETFRPNPRIDTAAAITELGVGEALVSLLDEKGRPGIVERALIRPPDSRLGPISDAERAAILAASPIGTRYDVTVDRVSAFERLSHRHAADATEPPTAPTQPPARGGRGPWSEPAPPSGPYGRPAPSQTGPGRPTSGRRPAGGSVPRTRESPEEAFMKSVARSVGSTLGRQIVRGILGSILRR
ncbi:helicase HerA-like domain-containing protein [Stella sp.]|uniref:helicase HerA-like domain-containing protein n=1 Tax=Stella sp. TaxID=2912054 RepID=UPI0035B07A96